MSESADQVMAGADRDRILAMLMEEWSPLQRELMDRLLGVEDDASDAYLAARHGTDACDLRRQRSLARARLHQAMHARAVEEWIA